MEQQLRVMAIAAVAVIVIILLITIPLMNAGQYQALAGGIQAVGVTAALIFGALTLQHDRHSKKVDRVLELHQSLTSGDLQASRIRLMRHLVRHSDKSSARVRSTSIKELRDDGGVLSVYDDDALNTPIVDLNLVLRFMERSNVARRSGVVDLPLFHELVCGHALWWNRAINADPNEPLSLRLIDLVEWTNEYRTRHHPSYCDIWDVNMRRDFGR
jgi:hypothetical protein